MPSLRYDPGIRPALRELNRIPGVRTRSSCQGKSVAGEATTHADLAYVIFHAPVPLALEERLLGWLGDVARVGADSVYSLWPERNAEFCRRLAESAAEFTAARRNDPVERWRVPLGELLRPIDALLRGETAALRWCLDCGTSEETGHGPGCRTLTLVAPDAGRRIALLERFLADDEDPPDPRLRRREGDEALVARIERGDFGERYRRSWRRFVAQAARETLRTEVRSRIAAERAAGAPIDLYFQRGSAVFCRGG